jgi:Fe2+ transport system protein FeoA
MITLADISFKTRARIVSFSNIDIQNILTDVGMRVGDEIKLYQVAPLGDPLIFLVDNTILIQLMKNDSKTVKILIIND